MELITQNNLDTIKACRYCPMCRQSCPSEFISYRESDAPRGRAILMHNVYKGEKEYDETTIHAVYNCFVCGACKSWCLGNELGGFDIPELIKFARRDIVRKGLAPKAVVEMKESLMENGNTNGHNKQSAFTASVEEKTADVLYILGEGVNFGNYEIAEAFIQILKQFQITHTLLKNEPTSGKELDLLGYRDEAKGKAKIMFTRIKATACKTIVVTDPLVYDVLKRDYPEWDLDLKGVNILHVSEYLEGLIQSGELKLSQSNETVTLADSEFLGRNNGVYEAPRKVLVASAGDNFVEMQWNHEQLQSAGEAAFIFDGVAYSRVEELGKKISNKAVAINAEIIITLSATAKNNVAKSTDLKVMDMVEYIAKKMI